LIPQPIDQVPLFLRLSEEERELVTARLRRRQAAAGELIVTEGQPSDALFVVTSGRVKLEGSSIDSTFTLANLAAGSLLGEEDMLLDRPYSTSARAAAATQLFVLSRSDLEDLVSQRPSIGLKFSAALGLRIPFLEQYLIHQRLRNTELLSALSVDDLRAISEMLDFRTATRGDLIVEAGSPGDTAFFIEEGQARMISKSNEGDHFEELDEGALFGHTALITGKPYAATVRAVTDVSLWALPRDAYQQLIDSRPAIKLAFSRALAESLSANDQTEAIDRMRTLQLFSDMPTEALSALTSRLVLRHYPAGEAIYTEGTPGDAMYIVESGEIRLLDSAFSDAHLLERMRAGESFGEMALLTGRSRAECARAASDTTLWVLYKSDFDDVMVQYPEISVSLSRALTERLSNQENDFVVRHLRRINLFSNLAASELKPISGKVRGLRFRPGEIICFAGQPAQTLFMIENGEIKQIGAGPNGEPVMLDILGPGESIGIQSIVQNSAYNATAQAMGEVELWTIDKSDFQSMMETYPALAITITRLMADQLMRSQPPPGMPPPPMRGQPGGPRSMPMPTRGPSGTPRPPQQTRPVNVPPPGARIQQPPSGARPIRPAPNKPVANPNVSAPSNSVKPAAPSGPHFPHVQAPHLQAPHISTPHLPHVDKPHVPTPHLPHIDKPHIPTPHLPHVDTLHVPTPHLPHVDKPHISTPHLPHVQAPHVPTPHLPKVEAPHLQAPHLQAPHLQAPHLRAPHLQAPHLQAPHVPGFLSEFGTWAKELSWGARLRVFTTGALLIWLVFITFPITTVSTVNSAVAGLQLSNQPKASQPVQLVRGPSNNDSGKAKVAYFVLTETPVPTKTPRPTSTPKPRATSIPATRVPTPVPVAAAPAAAAIPPLPPIEWDKRLGPGGDPVAFPDLEQVRIKPANVGHGQKFWRAIRVKFEGLGESGNDHTIYVSVLGEDGKRVDGKKLHLIGESSGLTEYPDEKSADDVCNCNYNYPMYGDGYDVSIEDQYPSDTVAGMCMCGIKNVYSHKAHVNFRVTFQLVTNP